MRKKIAAWITELLRSVVAPGFAALHTRANKDAAELAERIASLEKHLLAADEKLSARIADEMALIKEHVSSEVERPIESIRQHVASEITSKYDLVMEKAATAARESLADMRRTARMPCDVCKHISWKFKIHSDGRVICADCEAKLGHTE